MSQTPLNDRLAWRKEAEAVIHDVKVGVREIAVSEALRSDDARIFLNVRTLEGDALCVELTTNGFRVVGRAYDVNDIDDGPCYETPYALLERCSPMFRKAFSESLSEKLGELLSERQKEPES